MFFVYLWCWNIDCFQPDPGQANAYFSTDDLEAALMRCNNVLTTYTDPATKKWDTRMSNLTMKWDSSRKRLLEAVLSCEGLPSPNICPHCCEGKVLIRCSDCPTRFYCPSCDRKVHSSLPFHGREGFVNGLFEAIPPAITIGENGLKKDVGKLLKISFWLKKLVNSTQPLRSLSKVNYNVHRIKYTIN